MAAYRKYLPELLDEDTGSSPENSPKQSDEGNSFVIKSCHYDLDGEESDGEVEREGLAQLGLALEKQALRPLLKRY